MKIGELAAKFNISRDTIRYYINEGLLVPNGNAQYNFGVREVKELELILRMKDQQFSLQKIAEMLTLHRTSNMVEPETINECISLLENQRMELQLQVKQFQHAADSILEDEKMLAGQVKGASVHTGVPLKALDLLVCPCCG
jgi:DNA-binding transcriptional MerR regulator